MIKDTIYTKIKYFALVKSEIKRFFRQLRRENSFIKTTGDSLFIYEQYDNSEQLLYESGRRTMSYKGIYRKMTDKEARRLYITHVFEYVDRLLKGDGAKRVNILEVGCGNCINIVKLIEKYGDEISVTGIDISPERINVARKHYGAVLETADLKVGSITERLPFDDGQFDIVFSMHCLEQISYEVKSAIKEMYRLTGIYTVLIEPVFENGNFLQKLYLINSDHCRIILKTITELEYPVIENRVLDIQSNPRNQSSLIALKK